VTRDGTDQIRALLLTMDFPPTRGGIQTMAREILARARRTEFRVVAPADPGFAAVDAGLGTAVRRVHAVMPGRRGFVPTIALTARREIREWKPDVVLALHTMAAPGAMLGRRAPVVVACHGGELRAPRIRRVARVVLPRADRVVANSRFTRSEAVALGADPLRVVVLPVGAPEAVSVDPRTVEEFRARLGGRRIILSVARLAEHKGHDRLIRAVGELPDDVRLVIVGEGPARAGLESVAAAAGVASRVVFAGEVSDDDLAVHFASADAFALLSRSVRGRAAGVEGGGIALLEACAYGLPVVAGATGGVPETIRDGETGLLVDPDDNAAVVRVLRRVLEDGALSSRLGSQARAMAAGERSWAAFVDRMEDILETTARRAEAPR